jgi:serine/threonine protein phosphatase PrpC
LFVLYRFIASLSMLSLKVSTPPQPVHVYSDWSLGTSTDAFVDDAARALQGVVINETNNNVHKNTIAFTTASAQMAAYCPMEDKVYVNEDECLYAIFDGHGGDICSRYVVEKVPQQLLNSLKFKKPQCEFDYATALKSSFMRVDEQFLNEHKSVVKTAASGSCGVTVLIRNDTLYICNLGDSRVLIGGVKSHEVLTNDHNTKNEKERELVKNRTTDPMPIRGHAVNKVPGERVGGVLMVTRAFGDGIFKRRDMSLAPFIPHLPYITNEPEITIRKLTAKDRYAIISSDGLYEYFTAAEVASIVEKNLEITTDGSKIAAALIETQFEKLAKMAGKTVDQIKSIPCRKDFMDDITIIVLLFSPPPCLPSLSGHATN